MSKLLNFYDDVLKAADDVADVTRTYSRKANVLDGQLSMFDEVPTHKLAGFGRNKPIYQSNLAGLYGDLAPNSLQHGDYMEYLNGLSDSQIQDLLPKSSLDLMNAQSDQMTLQGLQDMAQNPDTQYLAEILRKHVK